jgi:hypothetical protein
MNPAVDCGRVYWCAQLTPSSRTSLTRGAIALDEVGRAKGKRAAEDKTVKTFTMGALSGKVGDGRIPRIGTSYSGHLRANGRAEGRSHRAAGQGGSNIALD